MRARVRVDRSFIDCVKIGALVLYLADLLHRHSATDVFHGELAHGDGAQARFFGGPDACSFAAFSALRLDDCCGSNVLDMCSVLVAELNCGVSRLLDSIWWG